MKSEKATDLAQKIENWRTKRQFKIGARIKEERKRRGFSLVELSRRLNIHRNTQSNYEAGEREPDVVYFEQLFKLGFDLVYIHSGEDLDEIPNHVASVAVKVFESIKSPVFKEDVRMLFYLFGLDEVFSETGLSDKLFSVAQAEALGREALRCKAGEFSEAGEAVAKFIWRLDEFGGNNPTTRAELILETLRKHKSSTKKHFVSMRDIAEDLTYQKIEEIKSSK